MSDRYDTSDIGLDVGEGTASTHYPDGSWHPAGFHPPVFPLTGDHLATIRREIATALVVSAIQTKQQDVERQAIEDMRAIRRNRNRFATLLVALLLGFFITWSLQNQLFGPASLKLAPYSFVITVLLDSGLAAYAYFKRY